jgi:uncharacterized protein (DUF58 family)
VKRTLLPKLIDAMAPLQPALVETDLGLVVAEVLRTERKRALVVLFTALDPGALGEGLLPVLPQLAAKHTLLVASVRDPAEISGGAQAGHPHRKGLDRRFRWSRPFDRSGERI